jgi:hypothetical protein
MKSIARKARPHAPRPRVLAAMVVASGAGVFVIIWQSKALRLEFSGMNLAWPALVAFGVAWATLAEPLKAGVAMVAGAVASLGVYYGALTVLPVTHPGMAIAASTVFAAIAGVCYVVPHLLAFGPTAVGYGVGLAVANAVNFRPTTSGADWFTVASAVVLAMVVGTASSVLLHRSLDRVRTVRAAQPIPIETRRRQRAPRAAAGGGR